MEKIFLLLLFGFVMNCWAGGRKKFDIHLLPKPPKPNIKLSHISLSEMTAAEGDRLKRKLPISVRSIDDPPPEPQVQTPEVEVKLKKQSTLKNKQVKITDVKVKEQPGADDDDETIVRLLRPHGANADDKMTEVKVLQKLPDEPDIQTTPAMQGNQNMPVQNVNQGQPAQPQIPSVPQPEGGMMSNLEEPQNQQLQSAPAQQATVTVTKEEPQKGSKKKKKKKKPKDTTYNMQGDDLSSIITKRDSQAPLKSSLWSNLVSPSKGVFIGRVDHHGISKKVPQHRTKRSPKIALSLKDGCQNDFTRFDNACYSAKHSTIHFKAAVDLCQSIGGSITNVHKNKGAKDHKRYVEGRPHQLYIDTVTVLLDKLLKDFQTFETSKMVHEASKMMRTLSLGIWQAVPNNELVLALGMDGSLSGCTEDGPCDLKPFCTAAMVGHNKSLDEDGHGHSGHHANKKSIPDEQQSDHNKTNEKSKTAHNTVGGTAPVSGAKEHHNDEKNMDSTLVAGAVKFASSTGESKNGKGTEADIYTEGDDKHSDNKSNEHKYIGKHLTADDNREKEIDKHLGQTKHKQKRRHHKHHHGNYSKKETQDKKVKRSTGDTYNNRHKRHKKHKGKDNHGRQHQQQKKDTRHMDQSQQGQGADVKSKEKQNTNDARQKPSVEPKDNHKSDSQGDGSHIKIVNSKSDNVDSKHDNNPANQGDGAHNINLDSKSDNVDSKHDHSTDSQGDGSRIKIVNSKSDNVESKHDNNPANQGDGAHNKNIDNKSDNVNSKNDNNPIIEGNDAHNINIDSKSDNIDSKHDHNPANQDNGPHIKIVNSKIDDTHSEDGQHFDILNIIEALKKTSVESKKDSNLVHQGNDAHNGNVDSQRSDVHSDKDGHNSDTNRDNNNRNIENYDIMDVSDNAEDGGADVIVY